MKILSYTVLVFAVLLAPAAAMAQATATAAKPLATVNGVAIPQKAFDQAVQMALNQGQADTPQLREMIRNQLVVRQLFLQEAAKQGLDKDPEVLAIAEEAKRNAMVQRYMRSQLQLKPPTTEQVKAEYEKAKSLLGPREFKLRVMQLPNDQRAKDIRDQIASGKDFAELARQWSIAPSSTRAGEIDWISFKSPAKDGQTNGLPLPIAQAVEKMQKGELAGPIGVGSSWWLVKLEDVRPTKVPTYEQSRNMLYNVIATREAERATTELVQRLLKSAKVTQ